jgi:hypothetical protein
MFFSIPNFPLAIFIHLLGCIIDDNIGGGILFGVMGHMPNGFMMRETLLGILNIKGTILVKDAGMGNMTGIADTCSQSILSGGIGKA